jgi:DNA-binding LytR/AlgR family response regulator
MTLRVLIVDDELLARRRAAAMLAQIAGVEVVGTADDCDSGLALIRELAPDVVLLDIKMPGRSGFDMLTLLDGPVIPVVIFVTAFNHYAIRAFEVSAVDYLLKPVPFDRMCEALDRARAALQNRDRETQLAEMAAVIAALRSDSDERSTNEGYESEFWVQRLGEYARVPVASIEWVAAERDYVRLYASGTSHLLRETMGKMEERLDSAQFLRIHRSLIVRRALVTAVRQKNYGAVKVALGDGLELPVGRSYVQGVRELLTTPASVAREGGLRAASVLCRSRLP